MKLLPFCHFTILSPRAKSRGLTSVYVRCFDCASHPLFTPPLSGENNAQHDRMIVILHSDTPSFFPIKKPLKVPSHRTRSSIASNLRYVRQRTTSSLGMELFVSQATNNVKLFDAQPLQRYSLRACRLNLLFKIFVQLVLSLFPVYFPVVVRHVARYAPRNSRKISSKIALKTRLSKI